MPCIGSDRRAAMLRKVNALIKHMLMFSQRFRHLAALSAFLLAVGGRRTFRRLRRGQQQQRHQHGLPGRERHEFARDACGLRHRITHLTASNLAAPIFFPAPKGVTDNSASGCSGDACTSSTNGTVTLVPGTVYQTPSGTQFPLSDHDEVFVYASVRDGPTDAGRLLLQWKVLATGDTGERRFSPAQAAFSRRPSRRSKAVCMPY